MPRRLENDGRTLEMAHAANRAFDDVTSHNQAVHILTQAAELDLNLGNVADYLMQRAARIVMSRAAETSGFMRQINPQTCAPYGIRDGHPDWTRMAPEIMVVHQMYRIIDGVSMHGLQYRNRDEEMNRAADLAAEDYTVRQKYFDNRFAANQAYYAETAIERLYLSQLDLPPNWQPNAQSE